MANILRKVLENHIFGIVTLTFTPDLDMICIHHHTKLGEATNVHQMVLEV